MNVAGLRFFHLDLIETIMSDSYLTTPCLPRTVEEAVVQLISELALRDKSMIANRRQEELTSLYGTLGKYIRRRFGLPSGNTELMQSCRYTSEKHDIDAYDDSALIIKKLQKKLRDTYVLSVVN